MDDRQAGVLATKLGDHPASHPVVKQLGGIVRRVLGTAIADGAITGIALDESDKPVIVAVSNGRAIRLQAIGDSSDDFSIASELLHFDRPDVSISVEHVHLRDGFSNEIFVRRSWRYELGEGRTLRLTIGQEPEPEEEALEHALASAAGWPE